MKTESIDMLIGVSLIHRYSPLNLMIKTTTKCEGVSTFSLSIYV